MDTNDAYRLGRKLMTLHGLEYWRLQYDQATKRAGRCVHGSKTIQLSRSLVKLFSEDEVRETLLHEISHALVGPGHGHDETWKDRYISIGGNGESRYTPSVAVKEAERARAKYVATCSGCTKEYSLTRKRKNLGLLMCGDASCRASRRNTTNENRIYLVWIDTATNRPVPIS